MRIVSTQNTEYLLRSDGACVAARRRGAEGFLTSHPAVGRVAVPYGVEASAGYVRGGRLYLMGHQDVLLTTEITVTEEVGDEVLELLEPESGVRLAPTGMVRRARREG